MRHLKRFLDTGIERKKEYNSALNDSLFTTEVTYVGEAENCEGFGTSFFDYSSYETYNTYQGHIKTLTFNYGLILEETLIGSRIDNVIWGNVGMIHTGIQELYADKTLSLSPNPVKDVLYLDFPPEEAGYYRIVNITGAEVRSGIINTNSISVTDLPDGLYHISIQYKYHTDRGRFVKD